MEERTAQKSSWTARVMNGRDVGKELQRSNSALHRQALK